MRQIWTSRKVWLPILLLFTAVFIFACWDRGVSIDYDGTGLYHASPLDSAIETVPVSTASCARTFTPAAATYPVCSSVTTSASSSAATRVPMSTAATKPTPNPRPSTASPFTGCSAAPRSACGANIPWRETASSPPLTPSCTPPSPSPSETVPHNAPHPPAHAGGCVFSVYLFPNRLKPQKVSGQTHPANSTTNR